MLQNRDSISFCEITQFFLWHICYFCSGFQRRSCIHKFQCCTHCTNHTPLGTSLSNTFFSSLATPSFKALCSSFTSLFLIFHIKCHEFSPHFILSLDTLDFLCHFLRESASRRLTIHILQKILQILIYTPLEPLRIQEYLRCPIPKFELRLFHTLISKRIDSFIHTKKIKGADEYDVRLTQVIIVYALSKEIHIDHSLIVTRPPCQFSVMSFFSTPLTPRLPILSPLSDPHFHDESIFSLL